MTIQTGLPDVIAQFLPIIIFLTVGPIVLYVSIRTSRKRKQVWREVADALSARFEEGKWFAFPKIRFEPKPGIGATVTVHSTGGKNKTYFTDVIFEPVPLDCRLQIGRQGFFSQLTKVFGAQDIETGDPAFDEKFVVKGDPADEILDRLTERVRSLILYLQSLEKEGQLTLKLEDHRLTVTKLGFISETGALLDYIRATRRLLLALLDGEAAVAQSARPMGEISPPVPPPAAGAAGSVTCRTCGGPIPAGESYAICRKCGRTYHRACWDLSKRCADPLCASTRMKKGRG